MPGLVALVLFAQPLSAQQQPDAAALSAFQRAKAQALLDQKLSCLGCHRLGHDGGRIGPDLTAVGARLNAQAIRRKLEDPQAVTPGGLMPRIPMPASTRELIVAYLAGQRGAEAPAEPLNPGRASTARTPAQQLYARHCAACHGSAGNGDGWNAAYLDRPPARHADARAMGARTDDRLFDAIFAGSAIMGGSARMPPFGQTLSTEEIRLLVAHIRALCRCRQPAWADAPR